MKTTLSSSVIIPTYNRPLDLNRLIESLLKQTVLPDELIIVDDGNLAGPPFERECRDAGISYIYFRKAPPGLTASRNAGIARAAGDIIFFFDDDVVLEPNYIEEVIKVYMEDTEGRVGGVSGIDLNRKPLSLKNRIRRFIEIFFLLAGKEGQVLPSGFCTDYGNAGKEITLRTEVDFLPGCSFSFRKEVFTEFRFDSQRFLNYGLGEDKDFSYRVSRKYRLLYIPEARVRHFNSTLMSPDNYKTGRMFAVYNHIFFSRYLKKGILSRMLFYYALSGYALTSGMAVLLAPRKSNFDYFRGLLAGAGDIIRGKTQAVGQ